MALGAALAVMHLRGGNASAVPWPLGALHGLLGFGGACCLFLSLSGPPRGVGQGLASFGAISAWLIGLAALAGSGVLLTHLVRKRRAGALIGVHATLAVTGFVILAAYVLA